MLGHTSLENYYVTNFALKQHHNWSITEMDAMIPWELEIYTALLNQYLEEEKQKRLERDSK